MTEAQEATMIKAVTLATLTVLLIVSSATEGPARSADPRAREQAYFERATYLKAHITEGWVPAQVAAIMGEPDRRESYADGRDVVDLWGYRGYEIAIEFRNGLVSNWFFRWQ